MQSIAILLFADCDAVISVVDQAGDDDALEDTGAEEQRGSGQLFLVQVNVLVVVVKVVPVMGGGMVRRGVIAGLRMVRRLRVVRRLGRVIRGFRAVIIVVMHVDDVAVVRLVGS